MFKARDDAPVLDLRLVDRMPAEGVPVLSMELRNTANAAVRVIAAGINFDWVFEWPGHGPMSAGGLLLVDPDRRESYEIHSGETLSLRYSFADCVLPCPIDSRIGGWAQSEPVDRASPWLVNAEDAREQFQHTAGAFGEPFIARWVAAGWRFQSGPPWLPVLLYSERRGDVSVVRSGSAAP